LGEWEGKGISPPWSFLKVGIYAILGKTEPLDILTTDPQQEILYAQETVSLHGTWDMACSSSSSSSCSSSSTCQQDVVEEKQSSLPAAERLQSSRLVKLHYTTK